jgi:hypothetical protein
MGVWGYGSVHPSTPIPPYSHTQKRPNLIMEDLTARLTELDAKIDRLLERL